MSFTLGILSVIQAILLGITVVLCIARPGPIEIASTMIVASCTFITIISWLETD